MKLLTVLGTRPEIIRCSEIIRDFKIKFNHKLVFTGQNFSNELSKNFFENFNIKPDINLNIDNKNSSKALSELFIKIDKVLDEFRPDAFFVLGDTNSALASIVAKKKKIPIFHYEAGNRCFDHRVPEEINRKIIDNTADVNLTYSSVAKQNLINENFSNDKIFNIGSPLKEVFEANKEKILNNSILKDLKLKKNDYILLSLHREENIENEKNFSIILNSIDFISKRLKKLVIFSVHPRTKKKLKKFKLNKYFKVYKPFDYFSYMNLQKNSLIVLSDSGSISEESYLMKFPALNLRETHERQEAMEKATVIMTDFNPKNLLHNINYAISSIEKLNNKIIDYDQNFVANKISNIIISYINYIKRTNYFK